MENAISHFPVVLISCFLNGTLTRPHNGSVFLSILHGFAMLFSCHHVESGLIAFCEYDFQLYLVMFSSLGLILQVTAWNSRRQTHLPTWQLKMPLPQSLNSGSKWRSLPLFSLLEVRVPSKMTIRHKGSCSIGHANPMDLKQCEAQIIMCISQQEQCNMTPWLLAKGTSEEIC